MEAREALEKLEEQFAEEELGKDRAKKLKGEPATKGGKGGGGGAPAAAQHAP